MITKAFENLQAEFIRIKAVNVGRCSDQLSCAGQKAWLMVSEVEIE
jgi:hypothetical protein